MTTSSFLNHGSTAYDLKNNHGIDILSLFTNYHMPTMQTDGLPFQYGMS